jgi:predicted O-methyltransferase YrrM
MSTKRNLIYACVFENRDYLKLLELLIQSINCNSPLDSNTDFLVITHPDYVEYINQYIHLHDGRPLLIYSMIKSSLMEAGCARLDIFSYPIIHNYDKILYLDTDILFAENVERILTIDISDDKLYALGEGAIGDPYHGKPYWDLHGLDPNTTAFTSGILYFKNSNSIQQLFSDIKQHIQKDIYEDKNYIPGCLDQPFIVYNSAIQNKYNINILCEYVKNIPHEIIDGNAKSSQFKTEYPYVLYHFFGGLGDFNNKYSRMTDFFRVHFAPSAPEYNKDAIVASFHEKVPIFEKHITKIETIIKASGEPLEGNSVYYHQTLNRFAELLPKQMNLFWAGQTATNRICEIGFNAGHSAILMLLARPQTPLIFTIFDIGDHKYMQPSLIYTSRQFPHVLMECIQGDSTQAMPTWISSHPTAAGTYDVIHVDGGHSYHCITRDMSNAAILVRIGGIIIIDDVYIGYINDTVNQYIQSGNYREVDCLPTVGYTHRIIQRVL